MQHKASSARTTVKNVPPAEQPVRACKVSQKSALKQSYSYIPQILPQVLLVLACYPNMLESCICANTTLSVQFTPPLHSFQKAASRVSRVRCFVSLGKEGLGVIPPQFCSHIGHFKFSVVCILRKLPCVLRKLPLNEIRDE